MPPFFTAYRPSVPRSFLVFAGGEEGNTRRERVGPVDRDSALTLFLVLNALLLRRNGSVVGQRD